MTRTLATSPDGQWAAARDGRELLLFTADPGPPVATLELDTDDVDVALVGPPTALVIVSRNAGRGRVTLLQPPHLDVAAHLDLETPAKLVAVTGPRLALLSPDAKQLVVVRAAGRALGTQKLEVAGPIEFVVGLERNQLLLGMPKKLEVWDAVSGRPLLRPQFQLPPPPRILGTAAGHMWAMLRGSDELFVYRLSDGRPFRHHAGSAIREVICHPASPILVLATEKGLVRLHCYAHSLALIHGVPEPTGALAQLASGDDISVLGFTGEGGPWRIAINGPGAVGSGEPTPIIDTLPAANAGAHAEPARMVLRGTESARVPSTNTRWREPLASYGAELVKGDDHEPPTVTLDTELGDLAQRLGLGAHARRALAALYALHLVGEPALAIARLAKLAGDWPEALGQGELGAHAMLKKKHGKVALRTAVTDLLDGTPPRHVRLVGDGPATPCAGAFRVGREGRSDAEIEAALATELGRIAIVDGSIEPALLEAHLRGATAVTMTVPALRPGRWPRDAGLVLVLYGTASSWVADVPQLKAS